MVDEAVLVEPVVKLEPEAWALTMIKERKAATEDTVALVGQVATVAAAVVVLA